MLELLDKVKRGRLVRVHQLGGQRGIQEFLVLPHGGRDGGLLGLAVLNTALFFLIVIVVLRGVPTAE